MRLPLGALLSLSVVGCVAATEGQHPQPAAYSLSVTQAPVRSAPRTVSLEGAGFVGDSRVRWNGVDLPTFYQSPTRLDFRVGAEQLDVIGAAEVTVVNPQPGGGTSGLLQFLVTVPPALAWPIDGIAISGGTWDVSASAAGAVFATRFVSAGVVRLNVATATISQEIGAGYWPYELAFRGAGNLGVVTHLEDRTVGVFDADAGVLDTSFTIDGRPIRGALSPTGDRIYVTTVDGRVITLNAESGAETRAATILGGVLNGLAVTPDGHHLWVSNTSGDLWQVAAATGTILRRIEFGGRPQDIVISADGQRVYASNEQGYVGVFDAVTGETVDQVPVPFAFGLALSPTANELWISSSNLGWVTVMRTTTRDFVGRVLVGGRPRHIAFTPTGVAVVANEGTATHVVRRAP